jgi:hypothetical protein
LEAKIVELGKVATKPVEIKWSNILDAEYAESWPKTVVHDGMPISRHTAPPPEQAEATESKVEVVL